MAVLGMGGLDTKCPVLGHLRILVGTDVCARHRILEPPVSFRPILRRGVRWLSVYFIARWGKQLKDALAIQSQGQSSGVADACFIHLDCRSSSRG